MRNLIGPAFFILPGLAMVFVGLHHVALGRASPGWPTTNGIVQSSSVDARRARNSHSYTYYLVVSYSYHVNGVSYTGHQIRYGSTSYNSVEGAQEDANRYGEGTTIQVHYRPEDPSESVLEPGLASPNIAWILPGVGGLFLLIGVCGFIQGYRFQKRMG